MICSEAKWWNKFLATHCYHDYDKVIDEYFCESKQTAMRTTQEWTKCCLCGDEFKLQYYY